MAQKHVIITDSHPPYRILQNYLKNLYTLDYTIILGKWVYYTPTSIGLSPIIPLLNMDDKISLAFDNNEFSLGVFLYLYSV